VPAAPAPQRADKRATPAHIHRVSSSGSTSGSGRHRAGDTSAGWINSSPSKNPSICAAVRGTGGVVTPGLLDSAATLPATSGRLSLLTCRRATFGVPIPSVSPPGCGSVTGALRSSWTGGNGSRGAGTRRSTHGAGSPHEQRRHHDRQRRLWDGSCGTGSRRRLRRIVIRPPFRGTAGQGWSSATGFRGFARAGPGTRAGPGSRAAGHPVAARHG
jgi:hypothetical protein